MSPDAAAEWRQRRRWRVPARPPPTLDRMLLPTASLPQVLWRAGMWSIEAARLGVVLIGDRLAGRFTDRQLGIRIRESFQRLGGTAVKLGQQLSIRVDMLPREVCEELGRLTDSASPFPVALARAALEEVTGVPADELLAELDEAPIGAASIACVWRGRLHSGEEVAIKVQRPNVAARFAADLGAFALMSHAIEVLSLVRPGFFAHMRSELRSMFLSELDFTAEARFQRLFRRYARRAGLTWVEVPRVIHELSGRRVMVSEFVRGLPCQELLDLAEANTPEAHRRLAELDIEPNLIGERILRLAYWGNEDAPFFHADPHPGNLLILPGSRILMLDFGAVGSMDGRSTRTLSGVLGSLSVDRPSLGADYAVVRLGPYPQLELSDFREEVQSIFQRFHRAIEDKKSPWTERTTAALWIGFLEAVQRYQIPVNLNTVQSMRSSLLYDSLAARLKPDMGFEVFRSYQLSASRRRAKTLLKQERRQRSLSPDAVMLSQLSRLGQELQDIELQLAQVSANPAVQLMESVEQGLRAVQTLTQVALAGAAIVVVVGLSISLSPPTTAAELLPWLQQAVAPWPVRAMLLILLLIAIRHTRFDLEQVDR